MKKRKFNKTEKSRTYFNLVRVENGKEFYECKICSNKINGTKGSNLTSHLQHHEDLYAEICSVDPIIEKKG